MLALLDAFFDGEERSALWMINSSLIEFEMTRSLDIDGDGKVTDDEFNTFVKENMSLMSALDHPYFEGRLDTDGDGTISMEERGALVELMSSDGAMSGAIQRAQLEAWDTNLDGSLDDAEREAGQSGAKEKFREMMAEAFNMDLSHLPEDQQAETRVQLQAQQEAAMELQGDMMMNFAVAQEFFESMRLENMPVEQFQAEMMADMPPAPDYMSFDADGDGTLSDTETAAFTDANAKYGQTMAEWGAQQGARMLRQQFEHAAAQSDANADGLMSPDEWQARLDMLTAERNKRLFLNSYDLDSSGRVTSDELGRYLDWYSAGSPRSDANYDGVLDARDLEVMLGEYQKQ
jgi:Ca2+-binding EF-hand superfamily protein